MIFVDTGAFLARHVRRDQHHEAALAGWQRLVGGRCLTTSHVLDETFTLLGRRAGYDFAAARARSIFLSSSLEIVRPGRDDELEALELFERSADQYVSYTDAVSFVVMRRRRVRRAFTFDRHFPLAGFEVWPEP